MASESLARSLMAKLAMTYKQQPVSLAPNMTPSNIDRQRSELIQQAMLEGILGDWSSPDTPTQLLNWLDGLHVCRLAFLLGNTSPVAIRWGDFFAKQLQRSGVDVENIFSTDKS